MNIFLADEQDVPLSPEPLRRLASLVMTAEQLPPDSEVAIMLVGDDQIAQYNGRFMEREGPTDVLAFPLEQLEPGTPPTRRPNSPPVNLGDIIVSPAYVQRQSGDHDVTFDEEMELMVVHGILHLLGYDHHEDDEAERMEARERELLAIARADQP